MKRILTTLSEKWPEYLLEILVITIGILGAFALNNWNENRQNEEKERLILSELNREFLENKEQLIVVERAHRNCYNNTKKIIDQFPIDLASVNLDSLSKYINGIHATYSFNPSQGTISSLISSSSFELISDRELRSLLVSWKDVFQDYSDDEVFANEYQLHNLFPYFNKHIQWNSQLQDPRTDLRILETIEFENQIYQRNIDLWSILENEEKELDQLKSHMDRIIELTSK